MVSVGGSWPLYVRMSLSNPKIFCIFLWGWQRGGWHSFCWRISHQSHQQQGWMQLGGTHASTVPGCAASCNIPLVRAVSWGAFLLKPLLLEVHILPILFPRKWIRYLPFLAVGIVVPHVLGTWLVGISLRFGILQLSPLRLGGRLGRINAPVW